MKKDPLAIPQPSQQEGIPESTALCLIACVLSAGLVFIADLEVPVGIAIGCLYIVPVMCTVPIHNRWTTFCVATWCSILILLSAALSPDSALPRWAIHANYVIEISSLYIAAFLGDMLSEKRRQVSQMSKLLTICAWTKKVKVNDRWLTLEEYLSNHLGLRLTHGISEDAAKKLTGDLGIEIETKGEPKDKSHHP